MKKRITLTLILVVILALSIVACADNGGQADRPDGEITFTLEVTDDNGDVTTWEIETAHVTVGEALLEEGLISGEDTDFGLMVTHVNGLRADFNEDGAYWAFYIDGEMAMAGVDDTEIEEGVVYALIFTPA